MSDAAERISTGNEYESGHAGACRRRRSAPRFASRIVRFGLRLSFPVDEALKRMIQSESPISY